MKSKQKSFMSNNTKRLSTFRPNSSSKNPKMPLQYNINKSVSEIYPPVTFTMPSYKKPSRMGNQITREELYEENMHLKDKINKMKRQLDEVKNKLFKRGLELNKKEKIIRDCSKENVTEYTHELNLEKAKESALLSVCKQKYIQMKKDYENKCKENDILMANIKITKLKEYQIQIDVLKKEMEKLRTLYINSQSNYENSIKEVKEMKEIKTEFSQQHTIINSLNKKYQDLSVEMNNLLEENIYLRNLLDKSRKIQKELMIKSSVLKISNDKYLKLKKHKENSVVINQDNEIKLKKLKKEVKEYASLYSKLSDQYQKVLGNKKEKQQYSMKNLSSESKNNQYVKHIEILSNNNNQFQLYKSLYEEVKIKNKILENFLKENDIDPEQIIKNKGYDGVMNSNIKINIEKLKQKIEKSSTNISLNNTKEGTPTDKNDNKNTSKRLSRTQSNQIDNNNMIISDNQTSNENIDANEKQKEPTQEEVKETEENKTNNIVTYSNPENPETVKMTSSHNSDFNTQDQKNKETQLMALLHTFVKNLEANHITKETLIEKIKNISLIFQNREEATKEEFIEPFINLFIDSMKVTQSTDIKIINEFFSNFIDDMEGDTNKFFFELIDIFENVTDYTLVENEEEVMNAIAAELQPFKDELKPRLEKYDNFIITFDNLRKVIEELNISLSDEYTEFLIYKMKENLPENSSIFDLNYKIVLELLDRSLMKVNSNNGTNNDEKKIIEEENESRDNYEENTDMNVKISNKLADLKDALKKNNINLEDETKGKLHSFNDESNKVINGIDKDTFFGLMEKYNIFIDDKVKEAIIDLLKIENDALTKSENDLLLLDYDKLSSILTNNDDNNNNSNDNNSNDNNNNNDNNDNNDNDNNDNDDNDDNK